MRAADCGITPSFLNSLSRETTSSPVAERTSIRIAGRANIPGAVDSAKDVTEAQGIGLVDLASRELDHAIPSGDATSVPTNANGDALESIAVRKTARLSIGEAMTEIAPA